MHALCTVGYGVTHWFLQCTWDWKNHRVTLHCGIYACYIIVLQIKYQCVLCQMSCYVMYDVTVLCVTYVWYIYNCVTCDINVCDICDINRCYVWCHCVICIRAMTLYAVEESPALKFILTSRKCYLRRKLHGILEIHTYICRPTYIGGRWNLFLYLAQLSFQLTHVCHDNQL